MAQIFFSYARPDLEFAEKLANDLRSAGVSLWFDQYDILPGDRWDSAVQNALKSSPWLLVVLSPHSVASENVMDEVAEALKLGKKVVPVLHLYPVHVMTRKSFGLMMRKLSVTESQRSAQFPGTFSRRKLSVASANWAQVA